MEIKVLEAAAERYTEEFVKEAKNRFAAHDEIKLAWRSYPGCIALEATAMSALHYKKSGAVRSRSLGPLPLQLVRQN